MDEGTLGAVQMLLAGKIGKDLAALVHEMGGRAVSLCGLDGNILQAENHSGGLRHVGELKNIDTRLINVVLDSGYIPIISTIAQGEHSSYSVDPDRAVGALAIALKAEKLILLTNGGIPANSSGTESLSELSLSGIPPLIKSGVIKQDMIPMIECCVEAIRRGVARAHVLDGRLPHSILVEMLSDDGIGTMIYGDW